MATIADFAERYAQLGLAVLALPPGAKFTPETDWQHKGMTDPAAARAYYTKYPRCNLGIVLGPSKLCSIDIDDLAGSRVIFDEWGIDLDYLLANFPTIRGKDDHYKIECTMPDGVDLPYCVIRWPRKDDPTKTFTVMELRSGNHQDVFPPSIHPETLREYEWVTLPKGGFPYVHSSLLPLWQNAEIFKVQAEALCPWRVQAAPELPRTRPERDPTATRIIDAWNAAHGLRASLERFGYVAKGKRYLSPHSTTKLAGVTVFEDGEHAFVHHASDPLCGRRVDAYDLFVHYAHGGDHKAAWKDAATLLGIERKPKVVDGVKTSPSLGIVHPDGSIRAPLVDADETIVVDEHSLADLFTRQNPGLRHVHVWGKWLEWTGTQWKQDDTLRALDLSRSVCVAAAAHPELKATERKKMRSAQTRVAVESLARADRRHAATVDQWDKDAWLLNTPSGVVDLRSGALRAGLPEDYATKITSVGPSGDCPQWKAFLRTVCDFDDDLVAYLQRLVGYSLTGDTREQAMFFFYGTGANGKGTFLNTLTHILGDYALVAGMDVFTESKHDRHPQELARMRGARFVCAQETDEGKRWAEARIKALTGGDPITAHFMRQDDFTFMPQFKLIIAGNHKPQLRNVDEAMKRRLNLIPFTVTIPPEQRDKLLASKLAGEASGILQWAIDGCLLWQQAGLKPPTVVRDATNEYLSSQDSFALWLDECTVKGPEKTRTGELYKVFKTWTEQRGEYVISQTRFNEMLVHRGFPIKQINGCSHACGLAKVENFAFSQGTDIQGF